MMFFRVLQTEFGPTLVLVLEYEGPAITAFSTPQRAEELEPESPVRAALVFEPPPDGGPRSENTLKVIFPGEP